MEDRTPLSRRKFLQLASLTAFSALSPRLPQPASARPNFLIVVFDAWSAPHLGMFGYPRQTMPLLESLSDRAIVYHRHYAAGPWTIPGAASLLTGTYPWTHRAFSAEQMQLAHPKHNLFRALAQGGYTTNAATHNIFADEFLTQIHQDIHLRPAFTDLFLPTRLPFPKLFPRDLEASALAQIRAFWNNENVNSALFLGELLKARAQADLSRIDARYSAEFPGGVPAIPVLDLRFLLEDGINHLLRTTASLSAPYVSYYHFYPPHQPYNTRREFAGLFRRDGIEFPEKPLSISNEGHTQEEMDKARRAYDEFLGYVDAEFYRLYRAMESAGQLEDTWLVLTSDHGELFERGNIGHETPMGYEDGVRVPLFIFPPGQHARQDVTAPTSAVDLLPTLMHLAGQPLPDWSEGRVLPPFDPQPPPPDRPVFVFHPANARARQPIRQGSATIVQGSYKFVHTFGLPEQRASGPHTELFDLATDPDELVNLYSPGDPLAAAMLAALTKRIQQADTPYL
jgi:arylsulfatase A-like enzyme